MESESKSTTALPVPEDLQAAWANLLEDRFTTFVVDKTNPIEDMMEELADLANACFAHFVRLWMFQQALNESPEVQDKVIMPKFGGSLGNT